MNIYDLRNNINRGKIENSYLFSGSEIGEKNELIRLLEKKIFQDEQPIVYYFYCDKDFEAGEFLDTLNSGLLFSEKKMVILKNIEQANQNVAKILEDYIIPRSIEISRFENELIARIDRKESSQFILSLYEKGSDYYHLKGKLTDKNRKKMAAYLSQVHFVTNPDTYLVVMNEANERIPALITSLFTDKQHIIFWEMFENKKIEWIRNQFKKYQLYINDDAVDFLLSMIENNKQQLQDEITKIAVSFLELNKNETVVSRLYIEDYLYHSKEESAFTLYNALIFKNIERALEILDKLFYTDEYSILGGLIWCQRRFLKVLDLYYNQKKPLEEIFKLLNISSKNIKNEMNAGVKNYTFQHGSSMFFLLAQLDYYLKVLPQNLKMIKLQLFIFKFCYENSQKSFLQGSLQFLQY